MPVKGKQYGNDSIVFKKQKVYEGIDYYGDGSEYDDLYFTLIEIDDDDNVTFPDGNIVLKAQKDGSYALASEDGEYVYYGLCDQNDYYWALNCNLVIAPFTPSSEAVVLPEGADPEETVYKHKYHSYGEETTLMVLEQSYTDGETVYLDNLCPDSKGWVKGTVKDGKLTVPTNQFLGADDDYLITFMAGKNYKYSFKWLDKENYLADEKETYDPADALTFTKVGDKWVLDKGQCVVEALSDDVLAVYYGEEINVYPGDKAAVPADPSVLLQDYTDYMGQWVLTATVPAMDVDGNYIRPENMELAVWEDDEPLVLSPDDGYFISEDVTWMPYGWMDEEDGYDLSFVSLTPAFYLYEVLFEKLGVQVRYTVDDETNYSNVVYMSTEGDEVTYEADHTTGALTGEYWETGIKEVKSSATATAKAGVYNLLGQRVGNNTKGLVISNGKKVLK